jgi:hypothetical protein
VIGRSVSAFICGLVPHGECLVLFNAIYRLDVWPSLGGDRMVSNHRFYSRRAAEESARARRALTPAARARHNNLANHFLQLVQKPDSAC